MSIDRISRWNQDNDSEDSKKKRKLFDSGNKKGSGSADDAPKKRNPFKKTQNETPAPEESYERGPSSTEYTIHAGESSASASPQPRTRRYTTMDGTRKPYDELSMSIKVRNRTDGDVRQSASEVHSTYRAPADVPVTEVDRAKTYEEPMKASVGATETHDTEEDEEWRGGTWVDSGYSATDEEAHRDKVYNPPNFLVQTLIVMFAQMKLFSKGKATLMMIVAIALIPILMFALSDYLDMIATSFGANMSNAYVGMLLALMPVMVALFTSKQCGTQIPNEFKDRTAYMSIPMPMHRLSFYFGKYLAGFLYCLALFLLAFGVAVACAATKFDSFYVDIVTEAFVGTIVAILVYSSTAFCLGCFLKRGSVLLPLLLNFVAFPMLFFMLGEYLETDSFLLAPVFLPDAIVQSMGFPISASLVGTMTSMIGFGIGFGNMWTMCGLGILWGAAFLALGAFRMTRREM